MGLEKQGSKPTGRSGVFMGKLMNLFHTGFYKKYYNNQLPAEPIRFLDLGCGGGELIRYLYQRNPGALLYGLDHSPEMVALSRRVNQQGVHVGNVSIESGSVIDLPYDSASMDVVSANETVQFWPDISKAFSEICRVLKGDGIFFIINRYPAKGSRWWRMAPLKDESDFKRAFTEAGFRYSETDLTTTKKGWIITKAVK